MQLLNWTEATASDDWTARCGHRFYRLTRKAKGWVAETSRDGSHAISGRFGPVPFLAAVRQAETWERAVAE